MNRDAAQHAILSAWKTRDRSATWTPHMADAAIDALLGAGWMPPAHDPGELRAAYERLQAEAASRTADAAARIAGRK